MFIPTFKLFFDIFEFFGKEKKLGSFEFWGRSPPFCYFVWQFQILQPHIFEFERTSRKEAWNWGINSIVEGNDMNQSMGE